MFPNTSPGVSPQTSCGRAALGALFVIVLPLTLLAREHLSTQLMFPFLHCISQELGLRDAHNPQGSPQSWSPVLTPLQPAHCPISCCHKAFGFQQTSNNDFNLIQIPTFLVESHIFMGEQLPSLKTHVQNLSYCRSSQQGTPLGQLLPLHILQASSHPCPGSSLSQYAPCP